MSTDAELAIRRVLAQYARAVDRRDWDLLRSVFHPDATDEHGPYRGDREGLVAFLEATMAGVEVSSHVLGQTLIDFDGDDTAGVETYAVAVHHERRKDGTPVDVSFGVRYVDRFEERLGRWAIADRVVLVDWSRSDDVTGGAWIADRFASGEA